MASKGRFGIEGTRADLEKLSAHVDSVMGFPMNGRNGETGEEVKDGTGITYRAADIDDHPTDPARAFYEVADENRAVAQKLCGDAKLVPLPDRTNDEKAIAALPAEKARPAEFNKPAEVSKP